ncbi:MAG: hypothetical protein IJ856_04445 [Candidatus Methanomethylophilaceae archaeon]|nr:hypothetical protein [Candidatus Methanomethylophilaceae archaeon]
MRINENIPRRTSSSSVYDDWTGNVLRDVDARDLDPEAKRALKAVYLRTHPGDEEASSDWDDMELLSRTGFLKSRKITVAAAMMLGKESEQLVPKTVCIRWTLLDVDGRVEDSREFHGPMLLSVGQAASMVSNSSYTLEGRTVSTYRTSLLMEALYNAVAYQDYSSGGTVDLVERAHESVTVVNRGKTSIDIRSAVTQTSQGRSVPPNMFLVKAMRGSGIVPGTGSGIRGMAISHMSRHLPLPTVRSWDGTVEVTIPGARRGSFPRALDAHPGLEPSTILDMWDLDRGAYVSDRTANRLVSLGLAEINGGVPFLTTEARGREMQVSDRDAVVELIGRYGRVTRADVALLLSDRHTDKDEKQISTMATNILQGLRKSGTIEKTEGSTKSACYKLVM